MKTILSWLGDPYLHLIGIATIVVAIAAGSSGRRGQVVQLCHRNHDETRSCVQVATGAQASELR